MHRTRSLYTSWLVTVLLQLSLLLINNCPATLGCPADVCICKWKGGKQTVECGGHHLPNIPEGMDPGTQVLNFSGNSLQVLQSERFLRMDLLNLQKIYLSRNQLIRIHEKAFRGLTNLVELDLSDNSLPNVPTETFQDYSSLMRLSLSGNPIRELKTSAFRHLSFLTTLELSNCQIERIENEAFIGMDNLEWLRLDGNRIGFIQGPHILPKSLHGISLQSNRWMCDCRLLDLHSWLNTYVTPQVEEPKCVEPPRLKGHVIKTLKKDELACLPEVTPESSYTEISEGRNVSLVCVVRAIPEPQVIWLFNGQVMSNDSLLDNMHMYYYIDESGSPEEKHSEMFIYNVGAEDNGTFSCVGKNVAGITFSNYTLRVIIKEPPVVNEVSFPRDYMNYILASSTGAGVIFVVMLCTIVIKCKQREPNKRKKCNTGVGSGSAVTSVGGANGLHATDSAGNDTGLMKCSSILNDGESLNGGAGLLMSHHEGMTPTKLCKENGGVIIGGQMKQNLLLYVPAHYQKQTANSNAATRDGGGDSGQTLQLSVNMPEASSTPPPNSLLIGNAMSYCSPPSSLRNNYQEKNPDLVNDAENVSHHHHNNKLKTTSSLDANDYDAASDCSGPCSVQGSISTTPLPPPFDNCYQLGSQYGSQIIRPTNAQMNAAAASRFAAMTTLPRGMQLKTLMNSVNVAGGAPQHQVDVHLNPVCFLGQDGFAYDYSNTHHMQQQSTPTAQPPPSHHLQLQPQLSLSDEAQSAQHIQQQQPHPNYYRTLPHNRAHKQQQFAASTGNSGMRYSLEAEFLQRPSTMNAATSAYDKYMPSVRFTAEGYPQPQTHLVQYPSPPEGYKSNSQSPLAAQGGAREDGASGNGSGAATFQQWPPCLPGYHVQAIRYPPTFVGLLSPQQQKSIPNIILSPNGSITSAQVSSPHISTTKTTAAETLTPTSISAYAPTTSVPAAVGKRCVAAQADASTIPECDENDISPTTSTVANGSMDSSGGSTSSASSSKSNSSSSSATTVTISASNTTAANAATARATANATANATEASSKLRHLNGPLADSPDEGYVGDSHEGSDI